MSKYILTIEGDFKKGECRKCPLHYEKTVKYEFAGGIATETELKCRVSKRLEDCPLQTCNQGNGTAGGEEGDNDRRWLWKKNSNMPFLRRSAGGVRNSNRTLR